MVTHGGPALDPSKLIILTMLEAFGCTWPLRHPKKHCVKFSLWETPGTRDMTIFGSHGGPHIPNIRYFEVYEGLCRYLQNLPVFESIWKFVSKNK